jgi:hypothetical protein
VFKGHLFLVPVKYLVSVMIDTGMSSGKCLLLGGLFSTLVQVSLGVICILALVIKRNNEVPRRDWDVWFLDVMKQGTHVLHYDAYSNLICIHCTI